MAYTSKLPPGTLSDKLRQAMAEHKADLLRYAAYPYVETIDGQGMLTGSRREQDEIFSRSRHWERLRYKIGVRLIQDEVERYYLPGTLWEVQRKDHNMGPVTAQAEGLVHSLLLDLHRWWGSEEKEACPVYSLPCSLKTWLT